MPLRSHPRPKVTPVAIPVRPFVARITLAFLIGVSFALLIFSRSNNDIVRTVRTGVMDVVTPILDVIARPTEAVHAATTWVADIATLREENMMLKAENARLMNWQGTARKLDVENQALRKLLNFSAATVPSYISTHIVGDGSGPYTRSALISAGEVQGVKVNQAVVGGNGLIGRVVETGRLSAQILLLTDINSRVPVMTEEGRERGILAGDNSELLELMYVPDNSKMKVGDRLLTSGDGGVFPAGIPVGVITGIDGKNGVHVRPLADWAHLEYVSVVDYTFGAKP